MARVKSKQKDCKACKDATSLYQHLSVGNFERRNSKEKIEKELRSLGLINFTKHILIKKLLSFNLFLLLVVGMLFGALVGVFQQTSHNNEKKAEASETHPSDNLLYEDELD